MPAEEPTNFQESWLEIPSIPEFTPRASLVTARKLISLLDLTSLRGTDTRSHIAEFALRACGNGNIPPCASVCVYPVFAKTALETIQRALGLSPSVKVAVTAGGFPHGLSPIKSRVQEITECDVADEIDCVIRRDLANEGHWLGLYQELAAMRQAAGSKTLKVILEAGELHSEPALYRAALCALMAGADFIKTSTGKEAPNPTLRQGFVMARALRFYQEKTGFTRGFKAAGGVRTLEDAQLWHGLVYHELGADACGPDQFRIGASSLWEELVRHLN